jgi:putative DNA primase/helicase
MEARVERGPWIDAMDICKAVHYDDQPFVMKLIYRQSGSKSIRYVAHHYGTIARQMGHFDEWNRSHAEPFLMLGVTDGQGKTSENVQCTWAVAVDLDADVDIDAWERHPFRPSIAIRTSEGRYHLVWILNRALSRIETGGLLVALATRCGGDPIFANVTQTIRLPGFVNGKYGTRTELVAWSDGCRTYGADLLKAAYDFDLSVRYLRARQPRLDPDLRLAKKVVSKDDVVEDLKTALKHIPPDDYGVWFRVGMALQSLGQEGYGLWLGWSSSSKKFNEREMPAKWESFANGNSISVATVFALAMKNGWRNPGFRKTNDGENQDNATERGLGRLVAAEMSEDYAVIQNDGRSRQSYLFLHWNGNRYDVLSDIERRRVIENHVRHVREVIKGNKDFREFLSYKSASNRALDDLSDHVGEYLVDESAACAAASYPYLGVQNGVLNLLSRELVPSMYRPLSLVRGTVAFDPAAKAELFLKTLDEIFEGDKEMIRAVVRLFGYVLLGNPKEHILIVLYGPMGRNGKTLLVQVLRQVFGDYAHAIPASVILAKSHNNEGPTPALAKLYGKRLAVFSEPSPKHPLDAGFIKLMTGGEHITARPLHGQLLEFLPEFTPVIVANKIPSAPDDDNALWRRMKIVKFERTFSDEEADVDLKTKLLQEASGILNLLLDGVQDYLKNGLSLPEKIKSAGIEQRKEFDPFETWLEECTMSADNATETPLQSLAANYEAWAARNRQYRRMSKKELSARLVMRGFHKFDRRRYPHFCGILLKEGPAA